MLSAGNRAIRSQTVYGWILFVGLLAMTARGATDPDLWWHLRTGQWIAGNHAIPHTDPFSITRLGAPWISHEWLSEIIFFQFWRLGGFAALTILSSVVTSAGFVFLYARCKSRPAWAAAATALGALASAPTWGIRPQMFTFLFTALLLWLVENGETKPKLLLWIPPIFLLWLNLHAGFALAPALLLAYAAGLICEAGLGTAEWRAVRPLLVRVFLILLIMAALVPLNPSGTGLFKYPFATLRSPGMRTLISEWFSPDFHQLIYRPYMLLWLLLVLALSFSLKTPKWRILVPLLFAGGASLDAARHIPIFDLLAVPFIARLPEGWNFTLRRQHENDPHRFRAAFYVGVVFLLAALTVSKWVALSRNQASREAQTYPKLALQSIRSQGIGARLFAYYDWGGYAIWKLYPQARVFVDGRADLYGDAILGQFEKTVELRDDWRAVLDNWQVDTVLLPPSCALTQALFVDSAWQNVFSDPRAVVFTRKQQKSPFPTRPTDSMIDRAETVKK